MICISRLPDHKKIIGILIIFYAVGVFGLTFPPTRSYFEILTPYTLLMNLALLMLYHKPWNAKHTAVFIFVALAGFLTEAAGVATGLVFGNYQYGQVLGAGIAETPLIIGVNWLMLIYFVHAITQMTKLNRWLQIPAGALLMVIYDLILEPVAIRMNMWSWAGGDIPLQNYAAWFIISLIFLTIFHLFRLSQANRMAPGLFAVQAGFILSLNIIYRFI